MDSLCLRAVAPYPGPGSSWAFITRPGGPLFSEFSSTRVGGAGEDGVRGGEGGLWGQGPVGPLIGPDPLRHAGCLLCLQEPHLLTGGDGVSFLGREDGKWRGF